MLLNLLCRARARVCVYVCVLFMREGVSFVSASVLCDLEAFLYWFAHTLHSTRDST
eukprot:m.19665 g.19665  ORF g.19665 m.19665 type:complete len:56 (-) comp7641_c0_seq1:194-361(-)